MAVRGKQWSAMGYGIWAMDYNYCWYGLQLLLVYWDGLWERGYGLQVSTAGILAWAMVYRPWTTVIVGTLG